MTATPPVAPAPTLRANHLRSAAQFGGLFALFTLGNVFRSRATAPWWAWVLLPTVSFLMFGGLAYGLLRSSGRSAPATGAIPVSGEFAVAVIGVFLLAIGVPVYLLASMDVVPGGVLRPTGIAPALWVAAVFAVGRLRTYWRR